MSNKIKWYMDYRCICCGVTRNRLIVTDDNVNPHIQDEEGIMRYVYNWWADKQNILLECWKCKTYTNHLFISVTIKDNVR